MPLPAVNIRCRDCGQLRGPERTLARRDWTADRCVCLAGGAGATVDLDTLHLCAAFRAALPRAIAEYRRTRRAQRRP